ncbi:MAG TPA: hypothetical protein VIK72_16945 [Clostridiaceae bacterium]
MKSGQDMFNEMLKDASSHTKSTGNLIGKSMKSISRVDKLETQEVYKPIKVKYKNWEGEVGVRTIIPLKVLYGHTDFHKTDQWLMDVWDIDKDAPRTYAILDIIEFIKED